MMASFAFSVSVVGEILYGMYVLKSCFIYVYKCT